MEAEEKYTITNEFLDEVREQFKLWATFLNTGVGLLSFTLAIACLGTNIPWVNALLSMLIIICFRVQGKHYFPSKVKYLRQRAKEDERAKILLKGLESEFLGFRTLIIGYPIFFIGFFFLFLVIFSPLLVNIIPALGRYFGI
ncbi:hypothetical protein [Microbulbifer sp. 2205BS26-8]|uniref:hypothetical protein n=1 Tax=Microbulbifer sp. 2205BS26-8 TaxID=3064386 RepID=UPI00273FB2E8|nr:hypothetical protein [Microbulbifer sp. 2205BS26-8]MDP5208858.1 hypothetical protein [Microbulbifer sp. 2205BS26-8]